MSYYEGLPFFLLLVLVLLVAAVLGWMEKPLGQYGFVVSLIFAALIFGGKPESLFYLLLFYGWSMLLIFGYARLRSRQGRKAGVYHAVVLLALLPLVLCKIGRAHV